MPAGTNPIFVKMPKVGMSNTITAANITKNLSTGTLNPVLFQSNTDSGSYLDHIRIKPLGTNVQSVARVFLNNGGATTQANNNMMISEITLPVTTLTQNSALVNMILPLKIALPPAWNVHVTIGTAVAAGWTFTAFGGDY